MATAGQRALGVTDPLRTIGPMQVQRWRLQDHFEQAQGRRLDAHTVKGRAVDIEAGVAARAPRSAGGSGWSCRWRSDDWSLSNC
jgi:hypothetical protein